MPRARNIKPGFFKNEILGEADPFTCLLFAGLWTLADKKGILEDRPLRIKAEIFAYRENFDINRYLTDLERLGFIYRYEVNGLKLIQVKNFTIHQNPHHTEKDSEYPAYSGTLHGTVKERLNNGEAPADSILLIPDSLIPDSGKKHAAEYSVEFEMAWAAYPARPGASKKESYKAWSARVKAGADQNAMIEGAMRYASYCKTIGIEPQFIKQPATFFGPGDHYLSDWRATAKQRKTNNVQDARLEVARQIMGDRNGNDRQIIDIASTGAIEGYRARIPEIASGLWQPDDEQVARD